MTVVGVVGDVRQKSLTDDPPSMVYRPNPGSSGFAVAVRSTLPLATIGATLRGAIREQEPGSQLGVMRTMEQIIDESVAPRRLQTGVIAMFALVGMLLASIGIFGVVAYATEQRRQEIGIRMALGANAVSVVRAVVSQGMTPVLAGAGVGVAGGIGVGRALANLLYGITPLDPVSFAASTGILVAAGVAACLVPAIRASRIDPQEALRID